MATYTVKSGDSLLSISKQFNVPLTLLQKTNGIVRATAGHTIKLPAPPKPPGGGIAMPPIAPPPVQNDSFFPNVDPFGAPRVTYGLPTVTGTQPQYPMASSPKGYGVVPVTPPKPSDVYSGRWRQTINSAENPSYYSDAYRQYVAAAQTQNVVASGQTGNYQQSERGGRRVGRDASGNVAWTYLTPDEAKDLNEQELNALGYVKTSNGGYNLVSGSPTAQNQPAAQQTMLWRDTAKAQQWLQNASKRKRRGASASATPQDGTANGQGAADNSQSLVNNLSWNIR